MLSQYTLRQQRARRLVNNALIHRELTKQPCLVCGELNVVAHHESYDRPLDVMWLCRSCHKRHHDLIGNHL
jgi:hypothetical protein